MQNNLLGKRFLFGVIMGICVSIVTIILKYDGKTYYDLVLTIAGIYVAGQTFTDYRKKENNG